MTSTMRCRRSSAWTCSRTWGDGRRFVAAELGDQLERHRGVDGDRPRAVGDADALEGDGRTVVGADLAEAHVVVEPGDRARARRTRHQATILLIGNSRMAVA